MFVTYVILITIIYYEKISYRSYVGSDNVIIA